MREWRYAGAMPLLEIEIVEPMAASARTGLARRLATASAEALAAPPGTTWIRVRWLDANDYAEDIDDGGGAPVFVRVLQRDAVASDERRAQAATLARAIAQACGRDDERVHVLYEPPGRGRVAFGGRLVE